MRTSTPQKPDAPVPLTNDQRSVLSGSAIRLEIVDALSSSPSCSITLLARNLGRKRSALYYHMQMLQKVGLVRESGRNAAGKRGEAVYSLAIPWMRFGGNDRAEVRQSLIRLSRTVHRMSDSRYRKAVEGGLIRRIGDYESAFVRFQRGRLDAGALAQVHKHLNAVADLLEAGNRAQSGDPYTFLICQSPLQSCPD